MNNQHPDEGEDDHTCEQCGCDCGDELIVHDWGYVGLCPECSVEDGEPHCPAGKGCDWCDECREEEVPVFPAEANVPDVPEDGREEKDVEGKWWVYEEDEDSWRRME
jgi:hypothetical protein